MNQQVHHCQNFRIHEVPHRYHHWLWRILFGFLGVNFYQPFFLNDRINFLYFILRIRLIEETTPRKSKRSLKLTFISFHPLKDSFLFCLGTVVALWAYKYSRLLPIYCKHIYHKIASISKRFFFRNTKLILQFSIFIKWIFYLKANFQRYSKR